MSLIRNVAKKLPKNYATITKQWYYRRQITKGQFISPEKEYPKVSSWISEGDWVLDIGANVGHYTRLFSKLCGNSGRVIAIEPNPDTFAFLANNVSDLPNITTLNVAATEEANELGFEVPNDNPYLARISQSGPQRVLGLNIASICLPFKVSFIKIDAEGHDIKILKTLESSIKKDRPTIMIEAHGQELIDWSTENGYRFADIEGSHNHILVPKSNDKGD